MEETPNFNPKIHTTTSSSTKTHINNSLSLNKASFKISKAMPNRNPSTSTVAAAAAPATADAPPQPNQPSQPPVYNIDKNNFRDVVQKLTGSPAHRPMPPPPQAAAAAAAARPPSSRLHRNRPPPLAAPRPEGAAAPAAAATSWLRPPLSPLPPFPTVSAAAESPITAYLRRLHSAPLLSPQGMAAAQPQSPLGFGCVPSPLSGYLGPLFPTSPGLPMPSPKWGDM